jgi:hypothetical protein
MEFILLLISFNESAMCNKNLDEISNLLHMLATCSKNSLPDVCP